MSNNYHIMPSGSILPVLSSGDPGGIISIDQEPMPKVPWLNEGIFRKLQALPPEFHAPDVACDEDDDL